MATWSTERRILYFLGVITFFTALAVGTYIVQKPRPTCTDGKQNQNELEVDCGGSCPLACDSQIAQVKTLWTRVFMVSKGNYDIAAMVQNPNQRYGVLKAEYNIRLVDADNVLVNERSGTTFINPGSRFMIFEPAIHTGERVATRAFISFKIEEPWRALTPKAVPVRISQELLATDPLPRLTAQVTNEGVRDLKDLRLVAVISDRTQNAIGASATLVEELKAGETVEIVFTWPEAFSDPAPVFDIYPQINLFRLE
jgi:hypothetical protein